MATLGVLSLIVFVRQDPLLVLVQDLFIILLGQVVLYNVA